MQIPDADARHGFRSLDLRTIESDVFFMPRFCRRSLSIGGVAWTLTSLCLPYSNEQFARSDLCWIFSCFVLILFFVGFFWFFVVFLLAFCWLFVGFLLVFVGFLFAFCLLFVCFLFSFCWLFVGFLFAFCWLFVGFLYVPVSQLAPGSLLSEPHAIRTPL